MNRAFRAIRRSDVVALVIEALACITEQVLHFIASNGTGSKSLTHFSIFKMACVGILFTFLRHETYNIM